MSQDWKDTIDVSGVDDFVLNEGCDSNIAEGQILPKPKKSGKETDKFTSGISI